MALGFFQLKVNLWWERVLIDLFKAGFCSNWTENKMNSCPEFWFATALCLSVALICVWRLWALSFCLFKPLPNDWGAVGRPGRKAAGFLQVFRAGFKGSWSILAVIKVVHLGDTLLGDAFWQKKGWTLDLLFS